MRKYITPLAAVLIVSAAVIVPEAGAYHLPRRCFVPDVKGKPLEAAETSLKEDHCGVGSVKSQTSDTVEKGHVISQSPGADRFLPGGFAVDLVVSIGPHNAFCQVPEVVGKSLVGAEAAIARDGCGIGKITHEKSREPKGHVISQHPKSGDRGPVGLKVNLTVSEGEKKK